MTKPAKIFILAGEPSGDRIGADLMTRLAKESSAPEVDGIGGDAMCALGLNSVFPMSDLSVMGAVDVVKNLPRLLYRLRQTRFKILNLQPDVVVLIDSQVFSSLLAKGLRRSGFAGAILLYVAPTVWVYAPERAKALVHKFDEILAILPFEPDVMAQLEGPPTHFVGHPALANRRSGTSAYRTNNHILLLPGSRKGELKRHLPMFKYVAERLHGERPDIKFSMPTLPFLEASLKKQINNWQVDVEIVVDQKRRKIVQEQVCMALTVSGTATLELAFGGVPMVVTYVMDSGQARIYKKLTLEHISLPNIILNDPLVPELLFNKPDAERLTNSVRELLDDQDARHRQCAGFERMAAIMETGENNHPRINPATRVMSYLN